MLAPYQVQKDGEWCSLQELGDPPPRLLAGGPPVRACWPLLVGDGGRPRCVQILLAASSWRRKREPSSRGWGRSRWPASLASQSRAQLGTERVPGVAGDLASLCVSQREKGQRSPFVYDERVNLAKPLLGGGRKPKISSCAAHRMASSVEQRLAAARERTAPAAAPAAAGGGASDLQRRIAASLRSRMAAHREWAGVSAALASARSLADRAFSRQGTQEQLKGLKEQFRELQSQLTDALSLQLRNEAKSKATTESISDAAARNEQLRSSVADLRHKRDKRTAVLSEQLRALEPLEEKSNEDSALQEKIEEAVSWYEKFLGFKIIGGEEGVKVVFDKIDPQSPEKEYSFCLCFDGGRYNLIRCDPHIQDVEELVQDLHLSDHLVKFFGIIREIFQSSDMNGTPPASPMVGTPDVSAASFSPPSVSSVNTRSEDVSSQSQSQSKNKGQTLPAKRGAAVLPPASPDALRRSPRFIPG